MSVMIRFLSRTFSRRGPRNRNKHDVDDGPLTGPNKVVETKEKRPRVSGRKGAKAKKSTDNNKVTESHKDSKNINIMIVTLDGEVLNKFFPKAAIGSVVFDCVTNELDLLECDYFGLQFMDALGVPHWLDKTKPVKKQVKIGPPYTLHFRVKFYAADPTSLQEELTRYQVYRQVRHDVLTGKLKCSDEEVVLLTSLAVQSELGDYEENEPSHTAGLVSEFRFVPGQTEAHEVAVFEAWATHKGMTPAIAESEYLEKAKWLPEFGVDMHDVRGKDGEQYHLGLTPTGVLVYQGDNKIGLFFWPKVDKLMFDKKLMTIEVAEDDNEVGDRKVNHRFVFQLSSEKACKHLWKCAVEFHQFYRLGTAAPPEKRPTYSASNFFRLSSRFRYVGRTEAQTVTQTRPRQQVSFDRKSSSRSLGRVSLQTRNKYKSTRPVIPDFKAGSTATLPATLPSTIPSNPPTNPTTSRHPMETSFESATPMTTALLPATSTPLSGNYNDTSHRLTAPDSTPVKPSAPPDNVKLNAVSNDNNVGVNDVKGSVDKPTENPSKNAPRIPASTTVHTAPSDRSKSLPVASVHHPATSPLSSLAVSKKKKPGRFGSLRGRWFSTSGETKPRPIIPAVVAPPAAVVPVQSGSEHNNNSGGGLLTTDL